MMTMLTLLEAVQAVAPQAIERAQRLQYAATLLRQGRTRREVSGLVFARYGCSRSKAWRLVNMAADLAEELQHAQHPQRALPLAHEPEQATAAP